MEGDTGQSGKAYWRLRMSFCKGPGVTEHLVCLGSSSCSAWLEGGFLDGSERSSWDWVWRVWNDLVGSQK